MSHRAASTWEGQENMLRPSECPLVYDFLYDSQCHLRRISPSAPATAVPGPFTSVSGAGGSCNCTPCTVTGFGALWNSPLHRLGRYCAGVRDACGNRDRVRRAPVVCTKRNLIARGCGAFSSC
ncbi:hypothetical protein GH5_00446 [Leishmania sp. Ghana 2012 LV757]|uniref:hypothetical protein n=1 Tax=Leishmania sp. Ghana 2012 LV757 TaxID=2803181 RepID=UPI001B64E291|nr:hypothetical protein GH5_00446 [Leishmania sp. Ghana 2012 LV757]